MNGCTDKARVVRVSRDNRDYSISVFFPDVGNSAFIEQFGRNKALAMAFARSAADRFNASLEVWEGSR